MNIEYGFFHNQIHCILSLKIKIWELCGEQKVTIILFLYNWNFFSDLLWQMFTAEGSSESKLFDRRFERN